MKKLLLILLCLPFIGFGQSVPQGINYQAVAREANGDVLMNQALTIQFSVISDITTSAVSWQETHTVTTNDYGLYTAIIGQGTSTSVGSSATFDVIDWGASNHLLKVEVDYGNGLVDMGTTAFMSVPYALYSATGSSTSTCGLSIGDTTQGGIIFYLDPSGCHGLVAKATDEAVLYPWNSVGGYNTYSFAYACGIYGGAQNTKKSIASAVANGSTCPAASVCDNLTSGGYTDWYLPSKDELDMMYVNLHLQGLGDFATTGYWSSTEYGTEGDAWFLVFNDFGVLFTTGKTYSYSVRAVRAF